MSLTIYNKTRNSGLNIYYDDLELIFRKTLNLLNKKGEYDISLIMIRSKKIKEINRDYRNIDKVTDVITFAIQDSISLIDEEYYDLGDIYINVDRVISQAEEYNHSVRREFCFLFTHGLLHSLGYDHMNKKDEKIMFDLQDQILDGIVGR